MCGDGTIRRPRLGEVARAINLQYHRGAEDRGVHPRPSSEYTFPYLPGAVEDLPRFEPATDQSRAGMLDVHRAMRLAHP